MRNYSWKKDKYRGILKMLKKWMICWLIMLLNKPSLKIIKIIIIIIILIIIKLKQIFIYKKEII